MQVAKRVDQITFDRAAQAAILQLDNGLVTALDQIIVETNLTKLVDDHRGLGHVRVLQQGVEKGRLAATEKAGDQRDLNTRHECLSLS